MTIRSFLPALAIISTLAATAAEDHSQMDHAAMGHGGHQMGPRVTTGPWSYHGRDLPKPYRDNRWEMVPVPGYGHMYVHTGKLSRELHCQAIMDNPRFMVDRKTRSDCGQTPLKRQ
ncbi:MAG: hypothetical protein M3Z21_06570 [Pseudomonadota bacterium]|nr:hypothetical protein [Pseudomonadota bacterium]